MLNFEKRVGGQARKLDDLLQEVSSARSEESIKHALAKAADHLDADWFSAMSLDSAAPGTFPTSSVVQYPNRYFERANDALPNFSDPVMKRCRDSTPPPIHWNQGTYVDEGIGSHWEVMSAMGVSQGTTCVLHLGPRRHFVLGISRRQPLKQPKGRSTFEVDAYLLNIAVALEPVMYRLNSEASAAKWVMPSDRELEALALAFRGLTDKQIASKLGIVERTASKHIQGCISKLRATNRTDAVAKGVQLGLMP